MEGDSDVPVVTRILGHIGLEIGPVYGLTGKSRLDHRLQSYNAAARYAPWFVFRDLNGDAGCAPELIPDLLRRPAKHMRFRIAVHATEAWLLADRERISQFLGVGILRVPAQPDDERDAKQTMVNLARRSRRRAIREDMVPRRGTSSRVGPGYTNRLIEYASNLWRPDIAARTSQSLARCIEALRPRVHT